MPPLASDLRRQLENTVVNARELAETASRAALQRWAVDAAKPFGHFSLADRSFRKQLRARGIQAGDRRQPDGTQETDLLIQELAYEYWHRMLFARFLAENQLLMHPDGVAVTLPECEELAPSEHAPNGFVLAARYASRMLPEIFRLDDVLLDVEFPINDRLPLEKLLASLPSQVFTADDSLGWVYQFWQSKKKDEVNKSGKKIDGRTLPAVTQLFTEHYMVEFLLHNTIGAWWCARHGVGQAFQPDAQSQIDSESVGQAFQPDVHSQIDSESVGQAFQPDVQSQIDSENVGQAFQPDIQTDIQSQHRDEAESDVRLESLTYPNRQRRGVQSRVRLESLTYLRWRDDGTRAAGAFEGWPETLKEFTMLDPCCGSGHFLVAGFHLLVPLRMHDEGLSAKDAADAVLRENLFGLELDPRCTQIAAFALALAAWKYPGDDGQPLGYRTLPPLNIACSGQGVVGTKEEWTRFANGDFRFREGMERLYDLFQKAPTLGSLINPCAVTEDLFALGFDALKGTLDRALKKAGTHADPDRAAVGVAAQGIALAASLMARDFTLVATNVPYLARGKQGEELRDYIEDVHPAAKADLATAFVERCVGYCVRNGTIAIISPHNWWFLGSYRSFRKYMLEQLSWSIVATLGEEAWQSFGIRGPKATLLVASNLAPTGFYTMHGIDALPLPTIDAKSDLLRNGSLHIVEQAEQLRNPDARIILGVFEQGDLLNVIADYGKGSATGDRPRFLRCFWELLKLTRENQKWLDSTETTDVWSGREHVTTLPIDSPEIKEQFGSRIHGQEVWGRRGIAVNKMRTLQPYFYTGEVFDDNVGVIAPHDGNNLAAVWCYVESGEYLTSIRMIDQKLNVTAATLTKVPLDLEHWQRVAAEKYPNGLPEPHSDDPTQWLFKGHPTGSTDPLQVAVARLLGYRWPDQEPDDLDVMSDTDGIVPIPAVRSEPPAADRLLEVLRRAFGPEWSSSVENKLLTEAGARPGTSLDDWLRNQFFEQHCKRFHNRPFIWHIWDGRKDGFACLVNLPHAEPRHAGKPDVLVSPGLDQCPGRRREVEPDRGRLPLECRPGIAGQAQAHPGRRASLRHLRALEAPRRTADRLEPRPQRRCPAQYPPHHGGWRSPQEPQYQVDQGPRQGTGTRRGRISLVLEGEGVRG